METCFRFEDHRMLIEDRDITTIRPYENNPRINMELDPPYCDVIVERFEAFTGKKADRISTGESTQN